MDTPQDRHRVPKSKSNPVASRFLSSSAAHPASCPMTIRTPQTPPLWSNKDTKMIESDHIRLSRNHSFSDRRECGEGLICKARFGGSMRCGKELSDYEVMSSTSSPSSLNSVERFPRGVSMDSELGGLGSWRECENDDDRFGYSPGRSQLRSGKKVASRYLHNLVVRSRHELSDHNWKNNIDRSGFDFSLNSKKTTEGSVSRAKGWDEGVPWGRSPGREKKAKEEPLVLFSGLKPPAGTITAKGSVGSLLSMGLELFKSRKSKLSRSATSGALSERECVHQRRLLQNTVVQWRYANARAEVANRNIEKKAKVRLLCASDSVARLRESVLQKKLQFDRERLEMKLKSMVQSHIDSLQRWSDMERQHLRAISITKDYLHSGVCKVPLVEGASAYLQSVSIALRHASFFMASTKSQIILFTHLSTETASLLSELAQLIITAKSLLQEFFELARFIALLELEERSLHCALIQLRAQQQQQGQTTAAAMEQDNLISGPLLDFQQSLRKIDRIIMW
ncbi:hypothetical protein Droror1_Dr00003905 [Drosera rotundifolia]